MENKNKLDSISIQEIKELIANNEITLCQLDNDVIERIMNHEVNMICLGEGDMELIDKCAQILCAQDDIMAHEDFVNIVDKCFEEHVTIISDNDITKSTPKARIIFKRIAIIAAIIMILVTSTIGIASAFGIDIMEYLTKVSKSPTGTRIDVEEFTFYHNGTPKEYSTIEEMLEKEELNIMYPTKWPDDIKLVSVRKYELDNTIDINFETNDPNIVVGIKFNTDINYIDPEDTYTYNEIMYVLGYNDVYYASCKYKNNEYYISAYSREDLIMIIENMKEYTK